MTSPDLPAPPLRIDDLLGNYVILDPTMQATVGRSGSFPVGTDDRYLHRILFQVWYSGQGWFLGNRGSHITLDVESRSVLPAVGRAWGRGRSSRCRPGPARWPSAPRNAPTSCTSTSPPVVCSGPSRSSPTRGPRPPTNATRRRSSSASSWTSSQSRCLHRGPALRHPRRGHLVRRQSPGLGGGGTPRCAGLPRPAAPVPGTERLERPVLRTG